MSGGIVSSLKGYDKQRNIIQNSPVVANTMQQVFACEELGSKKATKIIFVVIAGKVERT